MLVKIEKFVFPVDFVILDMPEDVKILLILGRPFFSTAHAKINGFKRKISLKVGNNKLVYMCQNPVKSIIRGVYVLGLRERMDLDLEARLMGETLILNNSTNHNHENFEEFIDLNVPTELRRDIVDDSDDEWYDCEVVNKRRRVVEKTKLDNDIFIELPPHLAYLCLYNNKNFPSIILSSLPERDRTLFIQILKRNGVEIKDEQGVFNITGLAMRERDASDSYNDTK